jgi:uncharacterized iron-regulated protein
VPVILVPIVILLALLGANPGLAGQLLAVDQVLDVKTGAPISFGAFLDLLAAQDVVYLGEEHENQWHVDAAVKVLEGLLGRRRQPVLALEMFSWDGQNALDHYLSDPGISRDEFLQASHWEQNWGRGFENYEPLIALARDRHFSVFALNPPRPLVRLVASKGMTQALKEPEMERWGMRDESFPEEGAYHDMIVRPLRQCHGGMSDEAYQRMYEASMFRDEGMAKAIVERLQEMRSRSSTVLGSALHPGPIVSYTGGGHVQYNLPIAHRVLRRMGSPMKQVSVYLTAFEPSRAEEIHELLSERIADYVWLTPLSAHGAPKRCK